MTNDERNPNDRNPKQLDQEPFRSLWHLEVGILSAFVLLVLRMHWNHEPTPDPSQVGNRQDADERLLHSWEGSGVGQFLDTAGRCGFLGLALILALLLIAVAGMMAADPATRQIPPPGIPIADGLDG